MFAVAAHNTARGYRQIVPDTGIDLKRRKAGLPEQVEPKAPDPKDDEIARLKAEVAELRQSLQLAIHRANRANSWALQVEEQFGAKRDFDGSPQILTIERRIAKVFGISVLDLHERKRGQRIDFARQAVMYWAARLTRGSYPAIGRVLDRRHPAIIHGVKLYREKRAAMGRTLKPARPREGE